MDVRLKKLFFNIKFNGFYKTIIWWLSQINQKGNRGFLWQFNFLAYSVKVTIYFARKRIFSPHCFLMLNNLSMCVFTTLQCAVTVMCNKLNGFLTEISFNSLLHFYTFLMHLVLSKTIFKLISCFNRLFLNYLFLISNT